MASIGYAAERIKRAADAPPEIHVLVPGFEVKELPVQLTNAVNLLYTEGVNLVADSEHKNDTVFFHIFERQAKALLQF